jgi:Core-2/I-Branching enzyme
MKLAHIILTHANPMQVQRLVARLQHEDSDFFIHVDQKTDIAPFKAAITSPNVHFVENRQKVLWAGYSIVEATLAAFREIMACGKRYDYINLLSGQDYPIGSTARLHHYLAARPGCAFMHFLSVEHEWQEAIPRVTRYHMVNFQFKGRYVVEKVINAVLPTRKMPNALVAVGRSQWFTLAPEFAQYILDFLDANPNVVRFFKWSWAPDEMIFQTVLFNSPLREKMVNDNLLYVDWSEKKASPKLLTIKDAIDITSSEKLFARKFDNRVDAEILDYLDKWAEKN